MDSTKYIGMDIHKETISIGVMNSAGKLVMESITKVPVCDPRKNALLKAGNKNDRIDARGARSNIDEGMCG